MGFSIGSSFGKALNSITGVSASSAKSQKYALQSMGVNNAYQKEFAQNAHQWEVQDLEKAGLNPILSAGGSGASASGGGIASGTQTSAGYTPFDILNQLVNAGNTQAQTGKTVAETEESNARTQNHIADTKLKEINTQAQAIEVLIKAGAKDALIKQEQQRLENMIADYHQITANTGKQIEETKRIQGGKTAEIIGTNPLKVINDNINEHGNTKGEVNHNYMTNWHKNFGKRNSIFK